MAVKPIDDNGPAYVASKRAKISGRVSPVKKASMPARSNKGGAVRGQARAAQVKKASAPKRGIPAKPVGDRRLPGPTPTKSATNPPPAAIRKAAGARVAGGGSPMPAWKMATINPPPKSGVPPRPITNVSPRNTGTGGSPSWLTQRPRAQVKQAK